MIILASKVQLSVLHQSVHVVSDGTFTFQPRKPIWFEITSIKSQNQFHFSFHQLYVIFGFFRKESVPCVFALTSDRTQETYTTLLKVVGQKMQEYFGYVNA